MTITAKINEIAAQAGLNETQQRKVEEAAARLEKDER